MKSLVATVLILLLSCGSFATIRRVVKDGDGAVIYNNIQTAINACVPGQMDTVLIDGNRGPWVIASDNLTIDRPIVMIGQGHGCGGVQASAIDCRSVHFLVTATADSTSFEGMLLYADEEVAVIANGATGIQFRRCMVYGYANDVPFDAAVQIGSSASVQLTECHLDGWEGCVEMVGSMSSVDIRNCDLSNTGEGIRSFDLSCLISIVNCVFINVSTPIHANAGSWWIENCVFWDNATWNGVVNGQTSACNYNAVENAAFNNFPGTFKHNLNGLNPFVAYGAAYNHCTDDLHLDPVRGASLIDAGNPSAANDRDGSPRDIGLYGGPTPYTQTGAPDFPFVTQFFVPVSVPQNGVLELRSTGRVGPGN